MKWEFSRCLTWAKANVTNFKNCRYYYYFRKIITV